MLHRGGSRPRAPPTGLRGITYLAGTAELEGEAEIDELYGVAGPRASPQPWPKGAARASPQAGRRASRHHGEAQSCFGVSILFWGLCAPMRLDLDTAPELFRPVKYHSG